MRGNLSLAIALMSRWVVRAMACAPESFRDAGNRWSIFIKNAKGRSFHFSFVQRLIFGKSK